MRRSGSRSRAAIISVLLLGALIFGAVYFAWNTVSDVFQPASPSGQGKTIPVKIAPGATTAQIADDLQAKGLIRNALAFRLWARVKGLDTRLQAGVYNKINSSMTIDKIVDSLLDGQPDAITVVIPEGFRLEQIAQKFSDSGLVKLKGQEQEFLNLTSNMKEFPDAGKYPLLKSVPGNRGMEGLLFPASYDIPVDADARFVINKMLETTVAQIKENNLEQAAKDHKMTIYQMLILASIVEREAAVPEDRGNIASVYWNRIFKENSETVGLLQADPTVQYGRDTQTPPNESEPYWSPLRTAGSDTASNSPWNTYQNKGFPPTPICSPGLKSMQAAAAPPATDYYYFFAKKDGNGISVFAKTKEEFEQLMQQHGVNNG